MVFLSAKHWCISVSEDILLEPWLVNLAGHIQSYVWIQVFSLHSITRDMINSFLGPYCKLWNTIFPTWTYGLHTSCFGYKSEEKKFLLGYVIIFEVSNPCVGACVHCEYVWSMNSLLNNCHCQWSIWDYLFKCKKVFNVSYGIQSAKSYKYLEKQLCYRIYINFHR